MARPVHKKRTKAEREEDTQKALELHRQGMSIRAIAEELGSRPTTVFQDIKAAVARAKEANTEYIDKHFKESIETLDLVQEEALDAWYESLNDAEKQRITNKTGKDAFQMEVQEIMGQCGDSSFLKIIVNVQIAKSKLFDSMSIKKSEQNLWQKVYKQIMDRKPKT